MRSNRRDFVKLGATAATGALAAPLARGEAAAHGKPADELRSRIDAALAAPVLERRFFPDPVRIDAVELLKNGEQFLVRVRSAAGATGLAVGHGDVLETAWPILTRRVAPHFTGKDARDLEALLEAVYLADSNYKWQGLAFWVPVACVELAVLDLLGQVSGKSVAELLGGRVRRDVAVYRASGQRGNPAEEEIDYLRTLVAETGAKAIKFRLGARMRFDDASTRRDLALIPLTRKVFGDEMTIYADANGSYDIPLALRIGRVMEEHRLAFFEEPVRFDYYDETKEIADALSIPLAGGEQESSLRRFRWMIEHRAVDVVQPDLLYGGGLVRAIRVARMAAAAGMTCTPHMSGGGLGYLYVAHFASCVPNAGPFQEYKGRDRSLPVSSASSSLDSVGGVLTVPTGPGLGVEIDPAFTARATRIT